MLISFGSFLAIFWAAQHVAKQNIESEKELAMHDMAKIYHTDKVRGPLNSEITLLSTAATAHEQVMVLQATVSSEKEVRDVKVRWMLPPNMTLVSGSQEMTIPELSPTQPYKVQITVEQKGFDNKQIHFIASSEQPGLKFSSVSQYNTTDQEFLQQQKEMVIKSLGDKQKSKRANIIH